jgi:hypothetical protein
MKEQILRAEGTLPTGCRVRRVNKDQVGTVVESGKNFVSVLWDEGKRKSSVSVCKLVLIERSI